MVLFQNYVNFAIIVICLIAYFLSGQRKTTIRAMPALEAIDEAVKRSVEQGKPVVFSEDRGANITYSGESGSLALVGLLMLGYVARMCARLGATLWVPVGFDVMVPLSQETVREAYVLEGKQDEYDPTMIAYLTNTPAFTAGLVDYMLKNRPGAFINIGCAGAETLTQLENAKIVGAINISGSYVNRTSDLIIASDYCLLGDEMYAAAAKVSDDESISNTVAGSDIVKVLLIALTLIGGVIYAAGFTEIANILAM
jgi:hypothetical protein